jgi:hypothetical protein
MKEKQSIKDPLPKLECWDHQSNNSSSNSESLFPDDNSTVFVPHNTSPGDLNILFNTHNCSGERVGLPVKPAMDTQTANMVDKLTSNYNKIYYK